MATGKTTLPQLSFDELLNKAKEHEKNDKSKEALTCLLIGPSGAGKSHCIGTLEVKTLYLYFMGERHGPRVAKKEGGDNIEPVCVNYADVGDGKGERHLTPDECLTRLRFILSNGTKLHELGFEAIVIDSLTELEVCVLESRELKQMSLTKEGKVDGFRVPANTKIILRRIFKDIFDIQVSTGLHFITMLLADVKEVDSETNDILECQPRLNSYTVADDIFPQFATYFVVNWVLKENGEKVHIFDFGGSITRESKDAKGRIKKQINFNPRIQNANPPKGGKMRADLSQVLKMVKGEE